MTAAHKTPVPGVLVGTRRLANSFGLVEALVGLLVGVILSSIAVGVLDSMHRGPSRPSTYATDVVSLVGLWIGLAGAAIWASRSADRREQPPVRRSTVSSVATRYGFVIRPWPDLLIGIAIGIAAQYLLVPLLELPLLPFVPHLFHRLGGPARTLTGGADTGQLVVLGVLVCFGSPLVEELFFRGLFLRGLLGRLETLGPRLAPVLSVIVSGVLFGLVHFEPLQLIGLVGFGIVLGLVALRTGRLGPGFVAHVTFNATTFIALAWH